jgi:hypothetical protein
MYTYRDTNYNTIDPKVAYPVFTYWQYNNGTANMSYIDGESCSWDKHFVNPVYREIIKFDISKYTCIDVNRYNLSLSDQVDIGYRRLIQINLARCTNSSTINNCYPAEIFDRINL